MTEADNPPAAVLAYLTACARHDANGVTFHDPVSGLHLATDRDGVPPRTAREVAEWTRQHRPDLWGSTATEKPVTTPTRGMTSIDVMSLARSGSMSAADAANALFASAAPVPVATSAAPAKSTEPTFTALMSRARNGDAAALRALETRLGSF